MREREGPEPIHVESPRHTRVSLSIVGGTGRGDGHTSQSGGAMSLLTVSTWLVGFEGRLVLTAPDRHGVDSGLADDRLAQNTLDFAALGGKRFGEELIVLDLIAGPALVVQLVEDVQVEPTGQRRSSATRILPRLTFASHFRMGSRSTFGGFVGLEGSVGPRGSVRSVGIAALAPAPAWLLGVAVGATLGLP